MANEEGGVAASAACTEITSSRRRVEGVFKWNLESFAKNFLVQTRGANEESAVFNVKASGNSSYAFQMVLRLKYELQQQGFEFDRSFCEIMLRNVTNNDVLVEGKVSVAGLDLNGGAAFDERQATFGLHSLAPNAEGKAFGQIIQNGGAEALNKIESLKMTFTIGVVEKTEHVTERNEEQEFAQSETKFKDEILQKLGRTLGDQKFADVEILCAGETFHCHKAILAAQSTVFRAMFEENGMTENDGTARVREMEPDILRALLDYIYTGDASQIITADIVTDLFGAADMYNVQALKSLCQDFILRNGGLERMTPENVCRLIVIADQHKGAKLKTIAVEFVAKNLSKMMKSVHWNKIEQRADLVREILQKMASLTQ